jgi:hypothetical protein
MLSSYNLCTTLRCLPDAGGLRDQAAEWVAFADVFAATESEYRRSQQNKHQRR